MKKRTGFVVVDKEWINRDGISQMLQQGKTSQAGGPDHLIIAPLGAMDDHRGLWIKNVTSNITTKAGSPVVVDFMIPWAFILGFGVLEETDNSALGLRASETVTVLGAEPAAE